MPRPDPRIVGITTGLTGYPERPPFHPSETWPESPFPGVLSAERNAAYTGVRETLRLLGLDTARAGTPEWNPLGDIISPGQRVVLKPNLVRHWNGAEPHIRALVTHGSVVRALLDYVLIALGGSGEIIVGDAPVQECDFAAVTAATGLAEVVDWVAARAGGVRITLADFRRERAVVLPGGMVHRRESLPGDPRGYVEVDLGRRSALTPLAAQHRLFRVTNYDPVTMPRAHNEEHNRYLVSGSVLSADVFVNIPKMKPHGKAGITCALKNCVGINGHKDWLAHHREGSTEDGGDEYPHRSLRKRWLRRIIDRCDRGGSIALKRLLYGVAQVLRRTERIVKPKDGVTEGSWYGNDTCWRMVHDLNRIVLFAGSDGLPAAEPRRGYFALVDGIVAGEGDGPLHVRSREAGVLVAGFDPVPVDLVAARLMGFDESRIPLLRAALAEPRPTLFTGAPADIRVLSDHPPFRSLFSLPRSATLAFDPHRGWRGHIELA